MIKEIISKPFDASFLASRNSSLCRFLNRTINNCNISSKVIVPKSTFLEHNGSGIVIGKGVKLGENVTIYHNVTLGNRYLAKVPGDGYPKIGNNVTICTGSIIVGKIKVGDNTLIGAGTFVDKDIPNNSIVYNKRSLKITKNPKKKYL